MASPASPPPPAPNKSPGPQLALSFDAIPDDLALSIATFLGTGDLCSLGSCSRSWRRLCSSDCLWASLYVRRWPPLPPPSPPPLAREGPPSTSPAFPSSPPAQGWKSFYVGCHLEMAGRVSNVIKFVEEYSQNESLEVGHYLKAVAYLHSLGVGFMDIKLFLLTVKHNVLINLIGLHYMIFCLGVPGTDVMEALQGSQISERQVCVKWFKLGRWFFGFRLPDESRSRKISLSEFATSDEEVRNVLKRGAIHEVLRVQITSVVGSTS